MASQLSSHNLVTARHDGPYVVVFFALLILTVITVSIAFFTFPTELINVLLALVIAAAKGLLVALFFMRLRFEGKLIHLIAIGPLILCVAIITALAPDVSMTAHDGHNGSLHLFNAPAIPK